MFIYNKKTKARLNANMQEGIFTMSKNTYSDLLTRRAHTQTHTHKMKRNPVFIGPSLPWRETSWGSEFGGVPDRRRNGVLHDAGI